MKRATINSFAFKNMSFATDSGNKLFTDTTYQFSMNEIIWLKGGSESGKSAIAKMLCGLVLPTSGDYLVNGIKVQEMTFEDFMPYRCNIGYSFDLGGLINNRDIMSNMLLANEYHVYDFGSPDELAARMLEYMKVFDLTRVVYEMPSAIIGGLRKAACVARAFVHEPECLILDDPTTGLKLETKNKLRELILKKKNNGSIKHVIVASNDSEFMQALNPIIVEIENGKIREVKGGHAA
ncbi:MAG: hypothetical protein A2Z20_06235 [Bdellovibrionales bacterium RBG_16_40_8]|nr:MAG: hypothetical protein A2Z20_06235 [Bdellovibrionales bacterium RBG_16_40_8]